MNGVVLCIVWLMADENMHLCISDLRESSIMKPDDVIYIYEVPSSSALLKSAFV